MQRDDVPKSWPTREAAEHACNRIKRMSRHILNVRYEVRPFTPD